MAAAELFCYRWESRGDLTHEFVQCCTTVHRASTLVWTSQALGRGCCNACPNRMHSSHWQLLSVKTGSAPSHPPQKALSSPQWHSRVLCCSSGRPEITPAPPLGHCSGRLPLSTVLTLNCAAAAGGPCLFNFPLPALQTLGPTMRGTLHPLLQPCRRPPVLRLHSAMCERKATKECYPKATTLASPLALLSPQGFFFFAMI